MPVAYYNEVANVKRAYGLLFRWKGSIYKLLWKQVLIYFLTYIALGLLYKYVLDEGNQKNTFERIALCCAKYTDTIPVVLFLGFFTGTVMQRWWAVYAAIPGTGRIITLATVFMKRSNPEVGNWLRTLVRYIVLSWMLCMRNVCQPLRNQFPSLQSMESKGFLLPHETETLAQVIEDDKEDELPLVVVNWALILIRDGRDQDFFEYPSDCTRLIDPVLQFKKSCSTVRKYQITAIPLSFIQAVTLTVHCFGISSLMGKQFANFDTKLLVIDCFLPILPAMQYLAYLSWLKLAEVAVNPFGEDDDDFDVVGLFEDHVRMAQNLLELFESGQRNPTRQSMNMVQDTLFKTHSNNLSYKRSSVVHFMDESVELNL